MNTRTHSRSLALSTTTTGDLPLHHRLLVHSDLTQAFFLATKRFSRIARNLAEIGDVPKQEIRLALKL
jgi:hypothetical protein